ncbi:MAG: DNA polymerase I [Minisyncoccota bacterium]
MDKKLKTLVLLDGNALIHRAYHALPPLTTKKGEMVNAVYGFTLTLLSVLEKFKPEYISASFDLAGPTFRDNLYEEYKAKRVKAPDDLYAQIPRVKEVVRAFNIPIYELEGFEADDCVGTLARQAEQSGVRVIIVTGDNDALQLVTPSVKVFTLRKGIKDTMLYDERMVEEKYGFGPAQIPDYKGLAGDASDNIPGVAGIGVKTATDLLKEFSTLEQLYARLEDVKESVRNKLIADQEKAFLSKRLGTIDTHAPITLDIATCVSRDFDQGVVKELLKELGFFSLLKRLPGHNPQTTHDNPQETARKKTKNKKITTLEEWKKFLGTTKTTAVFFEKSSGTLFETDIKRVHIAISSEQEGTVEWNKNTRAFLKLFLEDATQKKIVYDGKTMMHQLYTESIVLRGIMADVLLSAYLLNAGATLTLERLIVEECGEESIKNPGTKLYVLYEIYEKRLDEISEKQPTGKTLRSVLETIELPLLPVLFSMEKNGIYLNTEKFHALSEELTKELMILERDIYTFSGKTFNINSPKQLAEVLFQDLQIPTTNIKKTKTGISTASTELQKLQAYPIVTKIESYRELFKLKTTYLDALPLLVGTDGRLHTTFQQAVTATGRLSSINPNLQNIPARTSWSERIRGAFEAGSGKVLVSADYSQIELRVMAHMSRDTALTSAFQNGEDVHTTTASVVYKVEPTAVTADMRRQAKVFNFGILYGMGAFGLAQSANIEQSVASGFIRDYFQKFSGVAHFIQTMKDDARQKGYVETELGRRRYTPEMMSANQQVVHSAERMAINMPIQGLAADIMKLAMLSVFRALQPYGDAVSMLLQVHDELIVEVREDQAEMVARIIKSTMEQAYTLRVPLIVAVTIGHNWGEI